jgi:microcin C transport system substrate-binding protein
VLSSLILGAPAGAGQGISIDGKVKYPDGFERFEYASEKAVKGGNLVLHDLGGFDKLNPYTLKGISPAGVDELVFETLTVPSLDEPFASYGLIAEDILVAEDGLSVLYTINKLAKFSDGTPVTAEDVKFSLDTLKSDKAHPSYQVYMQDVSHAEVIDSHKVRLVFARKNRELHMIASQLPVFSKKFYTGRSFDENTLDPPVGSGPYTFKKIVPGKSITYELNPDYWARDLNVRRGMFNFQTITYKYFKDQVVALEAFKAGDFDFMYINVAKQWARDLNGPQFQAGELVKEYLPHQNNAGMQGFAFNTRRPLFSDRRIRKAMGLAFDFEWTNKSLFFDQYTRCNSYFSNSYLAAVDLPKGLELEYLNAHRNQLPAEVFTVPLQAPSTEPPGSLRENLRQAKELLEQAGWTVKDGVLTDKEGNPFEFEVLLYSPFFERVIEPYLNNLSKLGIKGHIRNVDAALYVRRLKDFDFDLTVHVFGQSQSPGNEQRDYWHSAAADKEGSRNLAGVKDPVVDDLVNKIIYAETQEELTAACKALDRVLWYGYYVVPNWYVGQHRIAYRNRFSRPDTLPLYYSPSQYLMTWWEKKRTED